MATTTRYADHDISGQTVLITGASAGIGEACALRFAEAGCKLILIARRAERLGELKKKLEHDHNASVYTVQLDLRNHDELMQLPCNLPEEFSKVDILVNNAGLVLGVASVEDNDLEDTLTMLNTNVTAVIMLTKLFVSGMLERNRGHIINISSIAGQETYGGGSVYCATKHALHAFTAATRHDLVGTRIRVTSISPGAVETEFSVVRFRGDAQRAAAVYEGIEPLRAEDIADNVLYAATRPLHVQIADLTVFATFQSSAKGLARVLPPKESIAQEHHMRPQSNRLLETVDATPHSR